MVLQQKRVESPLWVRDDLIGVSGRLTDSLVQCNVVVKINISVTLLVTRTATTSKGAVEHILKMFYYSFGGFLVLFFCFVHRLTLGCILFLHCLWERVIILCHSLEIINHRCTFCSLEHALWREKKRKLFAFLPPLSRHAKGFTTLHILPVQTKSDFGNKWRHYSEFIESPKLNRTAYDSNLWFLLRRSRQSSIPLHAYYIYECFHFAAWHCNK